MICISIVYSISSKPPKPGQPIATLYRTVQRHRICLNFNLTRKTDTPYRLLIGLRLRFYSMWTTTRPFANINYSQGHLKCAVCIIRVCFCATKQYRKSLLYFDTNFSAEYKQWRSRGIATHSNMYVETFKWHLTRHLGNRCKLAAFFHFPSRIYF